MKTEKDIERKIFLLTEEMNTESNLGKKSDISHQIKALRWVIK